MTLTGQFRRRGAAYILISVSACLLAIGRTALAQLPAEDELTHLHAAAGMHAELFAAEPLITNPAAIDVDTRGRVWVAEIQFYRKFADKPPADKIKVLEDTDGDGRADRVTVFAEGLFSPMSICVAGDKVFVATSPDLWVFEDRDGDLHADGPPRKLLTGFGGFNHDHGAHSLVLGPDHKWYMSHGDGGFDVTGGDGSHIKYRWGAMLRGELDGTQLETVAVNFRNPYELCVDSFGNVYCSDNDNDGNESSRICWVLPGGNYGWFGRPPAKTPPGTRFGEHWHFRGHIPGFVPATLVTGFGSPCGMCFYEGNGFGPHYENAPLHTDAGPREVRMYRHTNSGYGMRATSEVLLSSQGDDYFRPDDICAAPDGSLFVSDWYDGGVGGHAYNNPDQGRIFRLLPDGKVLKRTEQPGPYDTVADAMVALGSPNLATQFLAREKLLATPAEAGPALVKRLATCDGNLRARVLWLLDRIGGPNRFVLQKEWKSSDSRFRALAVRILSRHGDSYETPILRLASDPSPEVRREVLLAIRGLKSAPAFETLVGLVRDNAVEDRYFTECVKIAATGREQALYLSLADKNLFVPERFDLLQALDENRAVRFFEKQLANTDVGIDAAAQILARLQHMPSRAAAVAVWTLALNREVDPRLRHQALSIVASNLSGEWQSLTESKTIQSEVGRLLNEPAYRVAALNLITDHRLQGYDEPVRATVEADVADVDVRCAAIRAAARLRMSGVAQSLCMLVLGSDEVLRQAALGGLLELQEWKTLRHILSDQDQSASLKRQIVEQSMHTTSGALAIEQVVEADELPAELRQLAIELATTHADANVRTLFDRFVPESERAPRLGGDLAAEEILNLTGDAERGREVFARSTAAQCNKCHTVDGSKPKLGPDLGNIGKKYERKTLLETILDPSKAIAPEFVTYVLETENGHIHAGFLVERTDKQIVLKDAEGALIRIASGDVAALEPQPKSVMPELVLREITAKDAADLLAYLTTLGTK